MRTDNNPLTYVLTTAKLNATGHRWLAALTTYDFDIQYKPGRENGDADWLSRKAIDDDGWRNISPSGVKALCHPVRASQPPKSPSRLIDHLGLSSSAVPEVFACFTHLQLTSLERLSKGDLRKGQDLDSVISVAKNAVRVGSWPQQANIHPNLVVP